MNTTNTAESPRGELGIEEIQAVLEEPFDSLPEELLSSPEAMADIDEKPKKTGIMSGIKGSTGKKRGGGREEEIRGKKTTNVIH